MREINHLSLHQWLRSAIPDSQQPTSPIVFLFLNLPLPPCAVLLVKIQFKVSNYSQQCEGARSDWLVSPICTLCGMRWIGAGLPVQNGVLQYLGIMTGLGARGNWLKAEMQQREGTNTLLRVRIGYAEGGRKRRNGKGWEGEGRGLSQAMHLASMSPPGKKRKRAHSYTQVSRVTPRDGRGVVPRCQLFLLCFSL